VFLGIWNNDNNWWESENLSTKKFASSVLCTSFHPSSRVVIAGSADYTVRIITAFNEEADKGDGYKGVFDDVKDSGEVLYKVDNAKCWVNSVSWSPSGTLAVIAVHNSSFIFLKWNA